MRALLPVAALLVALTGCGSDAGGEPPPAEPPSSLTPMDSESPDTTEASTTTTAPDPTEPTQQLDMAAAREAFRSWFLAYAAGDGGRACPMQTDRFTRAQLQRAVDRDLMQPGASCEAVVTVAGVLYDSFGIDPAGVEISRVPTPADRVGFSVVVNEFAALGWAVVLTDDGWRVAEDLTAKGS
jgi:hypothetical protein